MSGATPTHREISWFFDGLWRAKAASRLEVPLVDTVVMDEGGSPSRWLFTSKTSGEVMKKRSVDKDVLQGALLRAALADPANVHRYVAVVRGDEGGATLVDEEAFPAFMRSFPSGGARALQAYAHPTGDVGTVYRNEYVVTNNTGKVVTNTTKAPYVLYLPAEGEEIPEASRDIQRSRDRKLNATLDRYTYKIVRYLEVHARVRVLRIVVEYILDSSLQPRVTWAYDIVTVSGTAARDLRLTGLPPEGDRAPDFLLGRQRPISEIAAHDEAMARGLRAAHRPVSPPGREYGAEPKPEAQSRRAALAEKQLKGATEVLHGPQDDHRGGGGSGGAGRRGSYVGLNRRGSMQPGADATEFALQPAPLSLQPGKPVSSTGGFPSAFRCSGDFCKYFVQEPGAIRNVSAMDIVKQFFAEDELTRLASRLEGSLPPLGKLARSFYTITYKSIAQARNDRRQLAASTDRPKRGSEAYVESVDGSEGASTAGGAGGADRPTQARKNNTEWARSRGEVEGGAARYYRDVKCCENCYVVYTTLDRARDLLAADEEAARKEREAGRRAKSNFQKEFGFAGRRDLKPPQGSSGVPRHTTGGGGEPGTGSGLGLAGRTREREGARAVSPIASPARDSRTAPGRGQARHGRRAVGGTGSRRRGQRSGAYDSSGGYEEDMNPTAHFDSSGGTVGRASPVRTGAVTALDRSPVRASPSRVATLDAAASAARGGASAVRAETRSPQRAATTGGFQVTQGRSKKRGMRGLLGGSRHRRARPIASYPRDDLVALSEEAKKGDAIAGEVEHPEQYGSFTKLDNYLRRRRPSAGADARGAGVLDELRGDQEAIAQHEAAAKEEAARDAEDHSHLVGATMGDGWRGRVLLVDDDLPQVARMVRILSREGYSIRVEVEGPKALGMTRNGEYDVLLIGRDVPALSGLEVARIVRQRESGMSAGDQRQFRLPIICVTDRAGADDLRAYMEVGMDGCVSKPVEPQSLINTVSAAVPPPPEAAGVVLDDVFDKEAKKRDPTGATDARAKFDDGDTGRQFRVAMAKTMPHKSGRRTKKKPKGRGLSRSGPLVTDLGGTVPVSGGDDSTSGVFQMDADTAFPYTILGKMRPGEPLFHFIVCQDMFDTCETMQIFWRKIVAKYPGVQVLVWNYPGQAFTEWRRDQVLNNEYMATCLRALVDFLGPDGTNEFGLDDGTAPFYLMGYGFGGSVALYYASHFAPENLRACLLINGYTHVDPHLAGVLHDCMNVFAVSPETRPDLPVYFYTRFLFCAEYLTRVGAPLALNLYTAVHNPMSLEGRTQLCQGALSAVDVRERVAHMHIPLVLVASTQDGLVKPTHVQDFIKLRGGEAPSIQRALQMRTRPCVVWLRAGHEVFQECRKPVTNLLEQLVTGYHERNDVAFLPLMPDAPDAGERKSTAQRLALRAGARARDRADQLSKSMGATSGPRGAAADSHVYDTKEADTPQMFEDKFLDNVVGTLNEQRAKGTLPPNPFLGGGVSGRPPEHGGFGQGVEAGDYPSALDIEPGAPPGYDPRPVKLKSPEKPPDYDAMRRTKMMDPDQPNFERRDNQVYKVGDGSKIYPTDVPEVKEYMAWRVRRNRKRLQRLETAASIMQKAWRAYVARTLVSRMREQRAALVIQRNWRGVIGRRIFYWRKKEDWAVRLVQRQWRGHAGRRLYNSIRTEESAARHIQRIFRGKIDRRRVQRIRDSRRAAAIRIQTLYRTRRARLEAWLKRDERNGAITIQRVYRGYQGRKRASRERDRYLFSKSQSQGIEFGRQMLMEHRLQGTRLQSEVSLLTKEKLSTEEKVEAVLTEIAAFENGVRTLEREMAELSKAEAEAVGTLDEAAKVELRENKMRLDREFGAMLIKIADRRETLKALEEKLQAIDRARQAKREELRDLERKLVVLLEEQQRELQSIKKRQERRGERMVPDAIEESTVAVRGKKRRGGGKGGRGGDDDDEGGGGGPTPQERAEAASLMASTETMMKFGFMSMSLTYFSSLNMMRAMKQVGAANTLMAKPVLQDLVAEKAAGQQPGGAPGASPAGDAPAPQRAFKPRLAPGQFAGEEANDVALWTVADVGAWLSTLSLGQYKEPFADAAVDGAFLYDLTDEDLRNTLGIEHGLHRKKILNAVRRLKRTDAERQAKDALRRTGGLSGGAARGGGGGTAAGGGGGALLAGEGQLTGAAAAVDGDEEDAAVAAAEREASQGQQLKLDELISWVRHGKNKKVAEALATLPDKKFDKRDVATQFIDGFGTQYQDAIQRQRFHINSVDEFGNTLLLVAAQNGNIKICQLLVLKGAYVDHQNNQGQTALHYAMGYNFYELGSWLADPDQGGASDELNNRFNMGPYDGLNPE